MALLTADGVWRGGSPTYGLRSYLYILFHAGLGKISQWLWIEQTWGRVGVFYAIRTALGLLCAAAETRLVRAVKRRFGESVASLFVAFLVISPGMFHASVSYLPQSFAMCCLMAAYGCWLNDEFAGAIFWMGVTSLIGWPFAVLIGVVMGIDILARTSVLQCVRWGVASLAACLIPMMCIDRMFYGRWLIAPLNIAIYNTPTTDRGEGANLYGVEPWHFFITNLFLNFNFIWLLNVGVAIPLSLIIWIAPYFCTVTDEREPPTQPAASAVAAAADTSAANAGGSAVLTRNFVRKNHLFIRVAVSCWGWILIMSVQPHKEERFLFVVYPFICLTASYGLCTATFIWNRTFAVTKAVPTGPANAPTRSVRVRVTKNVAYYVLRAGIVFVGLSILGLSVSRTYGYVTNYRAPLTVYSQLYQYRLQQQQFIAAGGGASPALPASPSPTHTVCVGKEWYRFPSHFFLEPNTRLGFLKSAFGGQLPQYFASGNDFNSLLASTARIPPHFNAANREEVTRYVPADSIDSTCDFIADLELTHQTEPPYSKRNGWDPNPVASHPFLDAHLSRSPTRAFWIPKLSHHYNKFAPYLILQRRNKS